MYPPFGWSKVTSKVGGPCLFPFPMMDRGASILLASYFPPPLPISLYLSILGYISVSRPEICVCRQDRERVGRGPTNSDQLALAGVAVCLNVSGMFGPQVSRVPASNFFPFPPSMAEQAIDVFASSLLLHRINCSRINPKRSIVWRWSFSTICFNLISTNDDQVAKVTMSMRDLFEIVDLGLVLVALAPFPPLFPSILRLYVVSNIDRGRYNRCPLRKLGI